MSRVRGDVGRGRCNRSGPRTGTSPGRQVGIQDRDVTRNGPYVGGRKGEVRRLRSFESRTLEVGKINDSTPGLEKIVSRIVSITIYQLYQYINIFHTRMMNQNSSISLLQTKQVTT